MEQGDFFLPPVRFVKRRRQKYLRLRVRADEILVSAPYNATQKEMEAFFQEKYSWVNEQYNRLKKRKDTVVAQNRFPEGYLYHEGEWKPVALHHYTENKTDSPSEVHFDEQTGRFEIRFIRPDAQQIGELSYTNPLVAQRVGQLYAEWGSHVIGQRFIDKAQELNFRHGRVTIKSQKTRWGSCSSKKNINLNWRLIKAPRFVQDYIFVHEMCHLVHLNHSPRFWALVDSHFPRRPEAEQWLRDFGPVAFQRP